MFFRNYKIFGCAHSWGVRCIQAMLVAVVVLVASTLTTSVPAQEFQHEISNVTASADQASDSRAVEGGLISEHDTRSESGEESERSAGAESGLVNQLSSLAERDLTSKENLPSTIKYVGLITIISLAPALFLMTTSYIRIVVVLSILRQALGIGQTPSTQVLTGLSLFMTILVMTPVWSEVHTAAIKPYTADNSEMGWEEAFDRGIKPVKRFMVRQIDLASNVDDIWMFYQYLPEAERANKPETFADVPIRVILPAFLISELKVAFLIGFSVFLPFLVLDLIVSSVSVSMGMVMLPPAMISLPMKLALFVLVDGWTLVVGMLLQSFAPYT